MHRILPCVIVLVAAIATPSFGVERVSFQRDDNPIHVDGKIVVEAADGGLLLQDSQGILWAIMPDEIVSRDSDPLPFKPLDKEGMTEQLLKELPDGFRVHRTAHYLLCYNTSKAYAEWCGALFERLYSAFNTYWKNRGFELHEPEWPLVALVFDGKRSYSSFAKQELGAAVSTIPGYFSLRTNRVLTYDLTGTERARAGQRTTAARINRMLAQPGAEGTVATIVHEATHQLAFNCGLQTRYADIPYWVSEGIANYFETPDLRSKKGWRNIGAVNRVRLVDFRKYLRRRSGDSLQTLLSSDTRFLNARTKLDAYAEAWALNYFLIRKHQDEYLAYIRLLSEKLPLRYDEAEGRLAQFEHAFGDLKELDTEFLRYMRNVR
jgi:hypothetical protein